MSLLKSLLLGAGAAAACGLPAAAETVIVTIDGVRSAKGMILAQLCDNPAGYPEAPCGHVTMAPAKAGKVSLAFDNIPAGVYVLQAFQDEDGDFTFSLPTEGYAFSNNAAPPRAFSEAAFTVKDTVRQDVRMTYKSGE